MENQRGTTLIEATIAVAIVALLAGAALGTASMAAHAASSSIVRTALQTAAQREMRIALDILKYQGSTLAPATVATTLPMPASSPLPAQLTIRTTLSADGSTAVSVTASSLDDATQSVTLDAALQARAPLPGSQVEVPGLEPAPTGAP